MDPALAGLAGAVATALVDAMATDFWATARTRLARIVGRGAPAAEAELSRELEESAIRVSRSSPPDRALAAEQARWAAQLTTFLAEHVEATAELRDYVEHVREALPGATITQVVQNVTTGRNSFVAGRDQHISLTMDDDG